MKHLSTLLKFGFLFKFIISLNYSAFSCHDVTLNENSATDNGDGTYTYSFNICLGEIEDTYGFYFSFVGGNLTNYPTSFNSPSTSETINSSFPPISGNGTIEYGDWDNTTNVVFSGVANDCFDGSFTFDAPLTSASIDGAQPLYIFGPCSTNAVLTTFPTVSTCGDCISPSCSNDLVANGGVGSFNQCENLGSFQNTVVNNYYSITTDATGSLGFTQLLNINCSGGPTDADAIYSGRTYQLFLATDCGGTSISATTANAGNSSTLNPEWDNLIPNTEYILIVNVDVTINSCLVDETCLDYYYPVPSTCLADIGTFTSDFNGSSTAFTSSYDLLPNETLDISAVGDAVLPPAASADRAGVGYAAFSCDPSTLDLNDLATYSTSNPLSCCEGFHYNEEISDINDGSANSLGVQLGGLTTFWLVPVTFDDMCSSSASTSTCVGVNGVTIGMDTDSDDCFAHGSAIQINYITSSTCNTCATATCTMSSVDCFDDRVYNSADEYTVGAGETNVTCYTINSGPNGMIGLVQQVSGGVFIRSAELFGVGSCGSAVTPSLTNANGVGSGFNPEWSGLTPNTDYVVCITAENLDFGPADLTPVSYSSTTCGATTCNTCATATCTISSVDCFDDRVYNPADEYTVGAGITDVTCYTINSGPNGMIGLVQQVSGGIFIRSAELFGVGSCGTAVSPSPTNANGVGSGFNPEWSGLTPNTDYIVCITAENLDFGPADLTPVTYSSTTCNSCTADVGTDAVSITGNANDPGNNTYALCYGDEIDIVTTGADPSVDYAIYTSEPTGTNPALDPGYTSYYDAIVLNSMDETSTGDNSPVLAFLDGEGISYSNNTIWWVPIATDQIGLYDPTCYDIDLTHAYQVTYLNDITKVDNIPCDGTASVTLSGGYPEFFPGDYNYTLVSSSYGASTTVSATILSGSNILNFSGLQNGEVVTYTITDDNGCPKQFTLTAPTLPTIDISSSDNQICINESVTINATGGVSYSFTPATITNGGSYSPTSTETIYVTGTDGGGCSNIDSIEITVNSLPTVVANASSLAICLGDSVRLTGSGANTYVWDNGITNGDSVSPAIQTTFTVVGTDINSCENTAQVSIVVNQLDDASFVLTDYCEGSSNGASSVVTLGGDFSFTNVVTDGAIINSTTGEITNGVAGTTYDVTYTTNGVCPSTSTNTVQVVSLADASFSLADFCEDSPNVATSLNAGGLYTLLNVNDGAIIDTASGEITNGIGGTTYTVTYTVGEGSCENTDTVKVYVDGIEAGFTATSTAGEAPLDVDFTNESILAGSYVWVFGTGDSSEAENPIYTYEEEGEYNVTLYAYSDSLGCLDTVTFESIIVKNSCELHIPTAFTPEGDGTNDEWIIDCFDRSEEGSVIVFNRWGNKVYESVSGVDYKSWDGTGLNGKDLPVGSYFYVMTLDGEEYNGTITLIR